MIFHVFELVFCVRHGKTFCVLGSAFTHNMPTLSDWCPTCVYGQRMRPVRNYNCPIHTRPYTDEDIQAFEIAVEIGNTGETEQTAGPLELEGNGPIFKLLTSSNAEENLVQRELWGLLPIPLTFAGIERSRTLLTGLIVGGHYRKNRYFVLIPKKLKNCILYAVS